MADDLNAMAVFIAVAEARGFRAAGDRLGVTASAVSQTLHKLEVRLGVVLVVRTTRSVRLTAAGEQLYAAVAPALADVRAAVAALNELSPEPRGTLRIVVSTGAEPYLRDDVLATFLAAHPDVRLDLTVSNEPTDIVAAGYDAGIRLGEAVQKDMVAVPISGDVRLVVVGAPSYLARYPAPQHPRDLVAHACLNWHAAPEAAPYRWEFTEDGRDFSVSVPIRLLSNDPARLRRFALAGTGVAMLFEDAVREDVARGDLVVVLAGFSVPFPGFFLSYPPQHASPALRALVEHLRHGAVPAPAGKSARRGR